MSNKITILSFVSTIQKDKYISSYKYVCVYIYKGAKYKDDRLSDLHYTEDKYKKLLQKEHGKE